MVVWHGSASNLLLTEKFPDSVSLTDWSDISRNPFILTKFPYSLVTWTRGCGLETSSMVLESTGMCGLVEGVDRGVREHYSCAL